MPLPATHLQSVQTAVKMATASDLSLRGGRRPTWQSREGSYVFADGFPVIRHCPARFPRRFAPRNDTSGWCSGAPVPLYSLISLHKALTTRKGHAASVRRQSRQRLRSERRYRRNWRTPFYRQPVRIGSIAPGPAVPSPTTRGRRLSAVFIFQSSVFLHFRAPPLQRTAGGLAQLFHLPLPA